MLLLLLMQKLQQDIYGIRYKCIDCLDFDFCFKCINTVERSHPPHRFVKLIDRDRDKYYYRAEAHVPGLGRAIFGLY